MFLYAGGRHLGRVGCRPDTLVMFLHVSSRPEDCRVSCFPEQGSWTDAVGEVVSHVLADERTIGYMVYSFGWAEPGYLSLAYVKNFFGEGSATRRFIPIIGEASLPESRLQKKEARLSSWEGGNAGK